ncbi:MAG: hypothetical protein HY585_02100 [Candidatus Omnitrophica bacterium]|nr:hypothetical protein [Candidatus Omnitrophota bacterium]
MQTVKNSTLGIISALAIYFFAQAFGWAAAVSSPLKVNNEPIEQTSGSEMKINQASANQSGSFFSGSKSVKKNKKKMMMGKCPM